MFLQHKFLVKHEKRMSLVLVFPRSLVAGEVKVSSPSGSWPPGAYGGRKHDAQGLPMSLSLQEQTGRTGVGPEESAELP